MHNHVIAGDFGYLPVYSDEEGYTHKSEALEGLKNYVNSVVDSVEACGVEHDWDWQIVLSVELGTCNIHKVNDYLCQDCHENSRTIELDYIGSEPLRRDSVHVDDQAIGAAWSLA